MSKMALLRYNAVHANSRRNGISNLDDIGRRENGYRHQSTMYRCAQCSESYRIDRNRSGKLIIRRIVYYPKTVTFNRTVSNDPKFIINPHILDNSKRWQHLINNTSTSWKMSHEIRTSWLGNRYWFQYILGEKKQTNNLE